MGNRNKGRKTAGTLFRVAAVASGLILIAGIAGISRAYADETVTDPGKTKELLDMCDAATADVKCTFNVTKTDLKGKGKTEIVGDGGPQKFLNCGSGELSGTVTWTRKVGYDVNFGGSLTVADAVGNLFTQVEAAPGANLKDTWTKSRTFSQTTTITVPVGKTGWITHEDVRVTATTDWKVVVGVNRESSPPTTFLPNTTTFNAPHAKEAGTVATNTRKHTKKDEEDCKNAPAPTALVPMAFDE